MRRGLLLCLVLLLAGCRSPQPTTVTPPVVTPESTPQPAAEVPPPPVTASHEPFDLAVTAEQLQPFFTATKSQLPGVFAVQQEHLVYINGDQSAPVLDGPNPQAFAVEGNRVLVTDGRAMFWFEHTTGQLTAIPELPAARQVAHRGGLYALATGKQVWLWTPGQPPVPLAQPDHLYAVYGVSISPTGRWVAVAYDLEIPQGPRATVVWVFDRESGQVLKWPTEEPKYMDGRWLLGWSGPDTLRFQTGQRGSNSGQTWNLLSGQPVNDGSKYTMMEESWPNPDGTWFIYRYIPEQVALEPIQPDAKPLPLLKELRGSYKERILLNGHPAFQQNSPTTWREVLPDGSVRTWTGVDLLF